MCVYIFILYLRKQEHIYNPTRDRPQDTLGGGPMTMNITLYFLFLTIYLKEMKNYSIGIGVSHVNFVQHVFGTDSKSSTQHNDQQIEIMKEMKRKTSS